MQDGGQPARLTRSLAAMGGAVLDEDTLDQVLDLLVDLARETVSGLRSVTITLLRDTGAETINATDGGGVAVDEAQYALDDGPCLEAIRTARPVIVDFAEGGRWPPVAQAAAGQGLASALSLPIPLAGLRGGMNLYGEAPAAVLAGQVAVAERFAVHAGAVISSAIEHLSQVEINERLKAALVSRELIGQAQGILMARERCTRERAFDILRRASQRTNRKVREIAEEIVVGVEATVSPGQAATPPGRQSSE